MDGGDTADVLLKLMKQDISVTLLVLWCSWNFPKHWISNSSRLYSSPYKLFVEKNEGFTLLFVLPFAFEDHVSFLGCCTEWHWVSAQFWPILKPPSTCLFMCMYNVVVLQFIDPSLVRCASDSQGNLLLQIIPRPNLYMTARNLSKLLLMCLWWDADSSTIILPADLDLDFFGTYRIPPHSSCFFHLCLVLSDLWHQQFPHCIAQSLLQRQTAKNTILNCRKSCSFRLWPWFLLVSESWQIKSLNFLSKFPEVLKARWVTGLEDAMVPPGGVAASPAAKPSRGALSTTVL